MRRDESCGSCEHAKKLSEAECKAVEARVFAIINDVERRLGLADWRVDVYMHRDGIPPREPGSVTLMAIDPNWFYRQASLAVNVPACRDESDDDLEYSALHEYLHLLLDPIAPRAGDAVENKLEERVVTDLVVAIRAYTDAALKDQELELKRLRKQLKAAQKQTKDGVA